MPRSPYYFDKTTADAAVEFFPRFLHHVDGEWAGQPFHLADWQAHHTRQIFGWRRKNGTRRYRFVRGWVPRKNGKSSWGAGLGHLLTIGDGEPGAQVYCHALNMDQASVVYEMAAKMVSLSDELNKLYEVTKTGMLCTAAMNAAYRPLTGESFGKHGLNPHANIGDEVHAWKNGNLHTFLIQGMGARRQPLDITISTAGEIKTYGYDLYQSSRAIFDDASLDPETYVFIYEAPAEADWTDPKVWAAANPNLGISLKREFLERECKRAVQSPRLENDFKRYHLNIWVEQSKRWFPMHRWADNTAEPKQPHYWKTLPQRFMGGGRPAFVGLDLGSTSDITAAVWVFPADAEFGGRVTLIPRFWVPEDTVNDRDSPRTPYRRWVSDGAMLTTPGNVTDYDFIEEAIKADASAFGCAGLAYDPWNATQLSNHLQDEGLPATEYRQGFSTMAAPSKELERLFISGQLEHGNHPVLEWMFGNATSKKDPAGNIKPDKEKAAEKIDGVVAAVMGVGLMNAAQAERPKEFQLLFV